MLKIAKFTRFCPAIKADVILDCQFVEINGRKVGPERIIGCNSKHICKLVYEDDKLIIKMNWEKCVLNQSG